MSASSLRPVLRSLLSLSAVALLAACGDTAPSDRVKPTAFTATRVKAQADLAPAPAFADQSGGGIFVTASGTAVRLRLDGSRAPLEEHPGNRAPLGTVGAVYRVGPHSALAEAGGRLFLADAGWLIEPSWSNALGAGLIGTAQTSDGSVWLAHVSGLFRLQDGALAALKLGGAPLTGITSLAAAPSEDGLPAVWFLREERLSMAVATAPGTYQVRGTDAPLAQGETVRALTALGAGAGGPAEPWLLTNKHVLRRAKAGWRAVELDTLPTELVGAGRFAWAKAGGRLLSYDADADADAWGVAEDLDVGEATLLAADESGCVWLQLGAETFAVSRAPVPRVTGLYNGMSVVEEGLVVRAALPPGVETTGVSFQLGDAEVPATGPLYSLGGLESDGTPKAYSLVGLQPGSYTLGVVARFADGSEARRAVPFTYQPLSTVAVSWEKDIRPIHESRCATCHTSGPGRALSTYALWKENAALITAAVRDQRMPADGPLDPQLISLIQRWAAAGAQP